MGFFIGKQGEYIKRIQARHARICQGSALSPFGCFPLDVFAGADGRHSGAALCQFVFLPLLPLSLSFRNVNAGGHRPRDKGLRARASKKLNP